MRRTLPALFAVAALVAVACGSKSPVAPAPAPPPVPACEANHTADITFRNQGGSTIDVLLDGGIIGSLGPQQSGLPRTVAAGVAHPIIFQLTNTRISLCAAFAPIPVQCSTPVYSSCTY